MSHPSKPGPIVSGVESIVPRPAEEQFSTVADFIQKSEGGAFGLVYDKAEDTWSAALHFGQEAPGSPMFEGAAYSISPISPWDAIERVMREVGI